MRETAVVGRKGDGYEMTDGRPPGSFSDGTSAGDISLAQVRAVLSARFGVELAYNRVLKVTITCAEEGRIRLLRGREWEISPTELEVISGEIWRRRAGWMQKRLTRGDFDAWVEDLDGTWRVLRLPYSRKWDGQAKAETASVPDTIDCYEWPTARLTGVLEKVEDRDGLPAYVTRTRVGE